MKLRVWKKSEAEKADKGTVFVRLKQAGNDISLQMVNREGEKIPNGNLVVLDNDLKTIVLPEQVTEDFDFKTDLKGSLLAYPSWQLESGSGITPVSYTHLTLPTKA